MSPVTQHAQICPKCQKKVTLVCEGNFGAEKMLQYSCGHLVSVKLAKAYSEFASLTNEQGHHLYPFQQDSLEFLRKANFRALLNLDMGLGKTLIVSFAFQAFKEELLPALVICKAALLSQWARHIKSALGEWPQIIANGKDVPMPDIFPVTIASFDILRRFENHDYIENYKTVVIDETQNIKNPDAARTKQLRFITRNIPHVIGLSGTPIKNHGGEYFSILNILRPDMFRSHQQFLYSWVQSYWDGYKYRLGGIRNLNRFREITKEFIIRYTRDEVMPDLPKVNRQFLYTELGSVVKRLYEEQLRLYTKFVDEHGFDMEFAAGTSGESVIGYLTKMRHITGQAKVPMAVAVIEEFLLTSDKKIVVFTHHLDVADMLIAKLTERGKANEDNDEEQLYAPPMHYHAGLSGVERDNTIQKFLSDPKQRVLIASTLAIGEGTNLQPVADAIMLERQWTPVPEVQAECRFPRPGATADRIDIRYITALGTIDEMFAELVEKKRQIIGEAIDGSAQQWDQTAIMRELAQKLYQQGKDKWTFHN